MPPKPITHDRFIKGLQSGFDRMSQPKGSVSRVSNMLWTRRGAAKTCDGSSIFSAWGGLSPLAWNPLTSKMWREMVYYAPSSGLRIGYYGLYSDPTASLGASTGSSTGTPTLTGVAVPPGGTGLTGTFFVKVTAVDGAGGETAASGEASISLSNQALHVSWAAVPNAYGYNVYIGSSSGAEVLWLPPGITGLGPSVVGQGSSSATIDGTWSSNAAQAPPTIDTSGSLVFTLIPPGGYSASNVIHLFPPAVSVFSAGEAATLASVDTSTPATTTVVQVRPTTSVQGGPGPGPNPFLNQQLAFDNDLSSFASAQVQIGVTGSNALTAGAQQTWTGWPAAPSNASALTINVNSSWQITGGAAGTAARATIAYSQDGGQTWQGLISTISSYNQATASASLRTGLDLSLLRVAVSVEAPVVATTEATMQVFEIWVDATVPLAPGTGTSGSGSIAPGSATPNGGIIGICGPLPQIVSLRGKMILALGNGISPYESDGSGAGTTALTNTFTATYPNWASATVYNQGDQIEFVVNGTAYVFTATQGGTSGTGTPTFPATLGQTVIDNNIIWTNAGQVSGSPTPRGAAHAEIYAGSLWLANTLPGMSADQLDGPSALRMSDLNNPDSWNPLNAAQIEPDDSDECQGIKAFTVAEAGIAPENFLMFFKNFATFLIQGVFGAANFAITRLQTDLGCVASRTIQFIPGYGIMRLSHLGFAVTDGINDRLQDPEAIRPYLFAESTERDIVPLNWNEVWFSKSAQTVDPPMYIAAMPLVGANSFLIQALTGTTVNVVSNSASTLPSGTYYVQAGLRGPNGVTSLSPVLGPFTVSAGVNTLQVVNAALPPGYYGFRIWFGTNPANLNQFVDGNSSTITILGSGLGGSPPQGIPGSLTRLFCYDLVIKAWTVVDLPFSISAMKQFRVVGAIPLTALGGSYDSAIRRWQFGDSDWDAGALSTQPNQLVDWSFTDAEVHTQGATVMLFQNQVIIRGAGGPVSISVTPQVNGYVQSTIRAAMIALGDGQFEARARILQSAQNLSLRVSGAGPAVIESIDYNVQQKPAGAALVFS